MIKTINLTMYIDILFYLFICLLSIDLIRKGWIQLKFKRLVFSLFERLVLFIVKLLSGPEKIIQIRNSFSTPKKAVMETPRAPASLYKVLTEGDVLPRSIIESALAESPLRVARVRIEIPRASRSSRKREDTSTEIASL